MEREIVLRSGGTALHVGTDGGLFCRAVVNERTGYRWENGGRAVPLVSVPGFSFAGAALAVRTYTDDRGGLSAPAVCTEMRFTHGEQTVIVTHRAYEGNPFFTLSAALDGIFGAERQDEKAEAVTGLEKSRKTETPAQPDTIFACPVGQKHLKVRSVILQDVTDANDTLARETVFSPYPRRAYEVSGQIFLVEDYAAGEGVMLVKEAPSAAGRTNDVRFDLRVEPGVRAAVYGSGADFSSPSHFTPETALYSVTAAAGDPAELLREWRARYRLDTASAVRAGLFCMSNTWGDRNQDKAVCEPFMLRETEHAKRLGVGAVQIDDGWQKGVTANSALAQNGVWGAGYYAEMPDFWSPHPKKFPDGLGSFREAAEGAGIRPGLWFSPDKTDGYAQWARDAQTLISLHEAWGIRFFKLDGITIETKQADDNLHSMLRRVHEATDGRVTFNLDITASRRWGYLYRREYGTLFVENRYTDWGNYYPHRTLRAAWLLCPYVPLSRLQLEFLNPRRNAEKYAGDPFAPSLYPIDWLFAAVCFANPLCWMEMQSLTEEDEARLAAVMTVWKPLAGELACADVTRVGEEPDGLAFTGLRADCGNHGYMALFRENGAAAAQDLAVPLPARCRLTPLYANGAKVLRTEDGVRLETDFPRSFALVKYE